MIKIFPFVLSRLIFIAPLIFTVKLIYLNLDKFQKLNIKINYPISDYSKNHIYQKVHQIEQVTNVKNYFSQIEQENIVKNIKILYKNITRELFIQIEFYKPILILNDLILCDNGKTLNKIYFDLKTINYLPVATISKDWINNSDLLNDLSQIYLHHFQSINEFNINIISPDEIQLTHKNLKNLLIIADKNSISNKKLLEAAIFIYKNERGLKQNLLKLDIRFNNFILSRKVKGVGNEDKGITREFISSP